MSKLPSERIEEIRKELVSKDPNAVGYAYQRGSIIQYLDEEYEKQQAIINNKEPAFVAPV